MVLDYVQSTLVAKGPDLTIAVDSAIQVRTVVNSTSGFGVGKKLSLDKPI